jgi:hypothetical protein
MLALFGLLVFSGVSASPAVAEVDETAYFEFEQKRFLGRGFRDRRTDKVLMLACEDSGDASRPCSQARFYEYTMGYPTPVAVGKSIPAFSGSSPTEREMKILKNRLRNTFDIWGSEAGRIGRIFFTCVFGMGVVVGGVMWLSKVAPTFPSEVVGLGLAGGFFYGSAKLEAFSGDTDIFRIGPIERTLLADSKGVEATLDRKRTNWSHLSKRISHRKYEKLKLELKRQEQNAFY